MRTALEWLLDNELDILLRMAPALLFFWNRRGRDEEGRRWIQEALERSGKLPKLDGEDGRRQTRVIAEAWYARSLLSQGQGDYAPANDASQHAAELARELGDNRLLALTLGFRMIGLLVLGDLPDTRDMLEECLTAARASNDKAALGMALAVASQLLDPTESNAKTRMEYARSGLALAKESGDLWGVPMLILGMAMTAKYRGDFDEARTHFAACEPIFAEMGDKHRVNMVKSELAHIERYEGHYPQADAMLRQTIFEWQRLGHRAAVAHQLESFASIAKIKKDDQPAGGPFGAPETLPEAIKIPMANQE